MDKKVRAELEDEILEFEFFLHIVQRRALKVLDKLEASDPSGEIDIELAKGLRARIAAVSSISRDMYFGVVRASDAKDPFPDDICEKCGQSLP